MKRRLRVPVAGLVAVALVAAAPAAGPLTAYRGKYPFDKVGSLAFVKHPAVRHAVMFNITDDGVQARMLDPSATSSPIDVVGTVLVSGSCQPHSCPLHNWALVMTTDGAHAAICYHSNNLMGEETRWFSDFNVIAKTTQSSCPAYVSEVPPAVLKIVRDAGA